MESYLYSPYELAIIIQFHDMNNAEYVKLLRGIFHRDNLFLQPEYRSSEKKLILSVMNQLNYLNDHEAYLSEQAMIEQDMKALGLPNHSREDERSFSHLIFKELRIRILFINKRCCARMKLRTLLSVLGYKRRSANVLNYVFGCLLFYHIAALRDNEPCDIRTIGLDEMITFRTV